MATPCPAMAPLINKMMIQMTQQTGQDLLQVLFYSFLHRIVKYFSSSDECQN